MRVAFLILMDEYATYEVVDTFIQLESDDDSLEVKIMTKYPNLHDIHHCYCNIVHDQFTKQKYLIVSSRV